MPKPPMPKQLDKTTDKAAAGQTAKSRMTREQFDALPDAEKERIYQHIDRMTPEEWDARCTSPQCRRALNGSGRRRPGWAGHGPARGADHRADCGEGIAQAGRCLCRHARHQPRPVGVARGLLGIMRGH